jgi:hypothetical protein
VQRRIAQYRVPSEIQRRKVRVPTERSKSRTVPPSNRPSLSSGKLLHEENRCSHGSSGVLFELVTQVFVYCRDAYVTTDIVFVAPEVSGPIAKLPISGNQKIDAGSVLFAIDPEPFELALQTQKAALDLANANLKKVQDQVGLATSEIEAKQAILDDAQRTRDRIVELSKGVRFRDLLWITLKKLMKLHSPDSTRHRVLNWSPPRKSPYKLPWRYSG